MLWSNLYAAADVVMKDDHATGSDLIDKPVGHPPGVAVEPIFSSDIPGKDTVSKPPGIQARCQALMTVRRTEQALPAVRCNRRSAGTDLRTPFTPTDKGK